MIHVTDLLALRVRTLWSYFKRQDIAFWAMCLYLCVEYLRPQQLIQPLYGLPIGTATLAVALAAYVLKGHWFHMRGAGTWLMLVFTIVIIASSLNAYDTAAAAAEWRLWFSWLAIYLLIVNVVNTRQRFAFYMMTWLLWHYYMSQGAARQFAGRGFTFANWGVVGAPGWFQNSGEFGIAMCMFLPISWQFYLAAKPHLTKWRKVLVLGMPVTATLGIIGSSSRGALLGLAAVGLWALARTKYFFRTVAGVAVLTGAVYLILPEQQKQRFSEMGEESTSTRRLTYWQSGLDMARDHPVLGIGYKNWIPYYRDHYVDRTVVVSASIGFVQLPHNIFIECMAELGYIGLSVFVAMILATFAANWRTRARARAGPAPPDAFVVQMAYGLDGALLGYLASGFFVTVLYYPFFWINLAFTVALSVIAGKQSGREVAVPATARSAPRMHARSPALPNSVGWRSARR